ncbi:MAG: polyprenyl synthetase family protein, partial [Rhodobacteraceae bacterium]|nr:polyprenyl synthetase family protein [Paracoccaceae bacterium]
ATASGADGMVQGQWRDLEVQAAHAELTEDEVMSLHAKKTGALLSWSVQAGAILAGEDPTPMRVYGDAIGLAYQIVDDLLDADQPGSEDASILHALGVEGARAAAANKIDEACDALGPYGDKAAILRELAQFVVERQL